MKLKFATILCAFAAMFSMASCTEEILGVGELPPLAGEVVLTDVVDAGAVRLSPNYVFSLELKSASGDVFEAKLASASTALAAGKYTEASSAYATAGNFITGAEGTKLTVGGETHLVTAGTITVAEESGSYSLEAIVKLDNGSNYSLTWAGGPVSWGEVLVATKLNTVMHTQVNQNKTITVKLAEAGVEFTAGQWGPQVTGGKGKYLSVDFYSEDEYLAAGTYTPSVDPTKPKKGEYVIGYDVPYDYTQWGGDKGVNVYGAAWHTVDATATPVDALEKITTGNITVAITDGVYTITVDNNEIYAQYVGEIPALLAPAVPADPWELTGDAVIIETEGVTMTMTDDTANNGTQAGGALEGVTLWFVELKNAAGDVIAWFDLVTKAGSQSLAGEYKVTSYPDEVGEAGNGWDFSQYGPTLIGGTILYDKANGKQYNMATDAANIKITEDRGQTTIIVKGKTDAGVKVAAKYVFGEIKEDEGGEGGACGCDCDGCKDCDGSGAAGEEDTFKGDMLTQLLASQQQYEQYKQMVLQFATEGVTVGQNNSYSGTGKILMLTIHAEKGDAGVYIPTGVYNASDSTMEANCWQVTGGMPEYNFYWGTYLLDVVDGKATMVELKEGTVTVEEGSITLQSGAYNLRYTGEIPVIAL
ncbi:MAG: hypothetical protein IKY95_04030 [Bacteroidales bacterium]|nr:hypothetical protein [Bacteroidales bacterium]